MIEVDPERFEEMVALGPRRAASGPRPADQQRRRHRRAPARATRLARALRRRSPHQPDDRVRGGVLPDRITIYRQAICATCQTEQEVADQVRRTVIHEVAHHFGIDDARLRELGW